MKKNLKHKVTVLSENESETVFGGFAPNTEMPVFFDDGKGTLPNLEEPKKLDFKCY